MDLIEQFELLKNRFLGGEISTAELPLGLEPLLWKASKDRHDEESIRKILNDLELVLFTLPAEEQAVPATELLRSAQAFMEARSSGDE